MQAQSRLGSHPSPADLRIDFWGLDTPQPQSYSEPALPQVPWLPGLIRYQLYWWIFWIYVVIWIVFAVSSSGLVSITRNSLPFCKNYSSVIKVLWWNSSHLLTYSDCITSCNMKFKQLQSTLLVLLLFLLYLQMLLHWSEFLGITRVFKSAFYKMPFTNLRCSCLHWECWILDPFQVAFRFLWQDSSGKSLSKANKLFFKRFGAPHWSTGFRMDAGLGVTTAWSLLSISTRSWGAS